ncbi:glutaminase [Rhodoplanes azumiensis]|uniref:glutaminase n=1 Tax=Rhodoplanes azumiensis TaxID=1897628 RepID=A0ABW5AKI5_9BRAD
MGMRLTAGDRGAYTNVSTGRLPDPDQVRALVGEAHALFREDREGEVSQVYPALARVAPDLFGICVVGTGGNVHAVGDTEVPFSIMSVSKPFVFALVCEVIGPARARERLGANSTGLPFNSAAAVEWSPDGRTNPMVNAGAIATKAAPTCRSTWSVSFSPPPRSCRSASGSTISTAGAWRSPRPTRRSISPASPRPRC